MAIFSNATELVGHTPLMYADRFAKKESIDARIIAKLEGYNLSGSIKDRIALAMIKDAIESGKLKEGGTVIEPTSGNTGIGIASVATALGYKAVITLPDTMSVERRNMLKAYGAELVLTDGSQGMKGAIAKAQEIHENTPNSTILGQFENPVNPQIHEKTTGPEIWEAADGNVDVLVAGIGTGGTITGIGKYLKSKNPNVKIIGVEPATSPIITEGHAGSHKIQGIGAGFIPDTLDQSVYDEVVTVTNEDAFAFGKSFATSEGVLVGISAGAALSAAKDIASRDEFKGKNIVVIIPDNGDRYLSTALYSD